MSKPTKYCTCCNADKPAAWFEGNEKSPDGTFATCEPCRNKWRKWKAKTRKNPRVMRRQVVEVTEKVCRRCNHGRGPAQPASNFSKNKCNPDGLADNCLKCQHRAAAVRKETNRIEGRAEPSKYCPLSPQVIAEMLAKGEIQDQTPGYWMKSKEDGKPPCWREVRDYKRAWENIVAPPKTDKTEDGTLRGLEVALPPGGAVGAALLQPPSLDIHPTPTNKASALRQLEMWASLAG